MTEPLRLYTFSISHFSEKIRWVLTHEKIPFEETPWTPVLHVLPARMRGRGTTVPVLASAGTHVQDSTRILHWLDTNRGPLSLLPTDEPTRQAALETEHRFDQVGDDVIRLAYAHVLPDTAAVVKLWTLDASPMQARTIQLGFPLFRGLFRRRLNTSEERVARSRERMEQGLAFIAQRTAEHRYLVGDRLTIADVTAAALLAPLVCPDEHPVYASPAYRASMAAAVEPWRMHRAFEWVRGIYRDHRGEWPRAAHVTRKLAS